MRETYIFQGTLLQRLERFKAIKALGITGSSGTLSAFTDYRAGDRSRTFTLGGSFCPSGRFHYIHDSIVYSDYIQHKGWKASNNDIVCGIVFRLPNGRFLGGWARPDNLIAHIDKIIFSNEYMAVVHADYLAKCEADAWESVSMSPPALQDYEVAVAC